MPQRSNDFQRLVKTIHDAMIKVDGGTVTESALLLEPDGTRREVDILLERRIADVTVRLAVECRDRSRRSDVEWIDALIGKFQRLDVDKIVAVSSTGFTAAAASKAAEHNIEVRALKQCFAGDWRAEFSSLGFAALEILPRVKQVQAVFVPPVTEVISKATTVVCPGQVGEQTFGRLVKCLPCTTRSAETQAIRRRDGAFAAGNSGGTRSVLGSRGSGRARRHLACCEQWHSTQNRSTVVRGHSRGSDDIGEDEAFQIWRCSARFDRSP